MLKRILEKNKSALVTLLTMSVLVIIVFVITFSNTIFAQSGDTTPPKISSVKTTEISDNTVRITWTTDEITDATINYGLDKNYGTLRDPSPDQKEHVIDVSGLDPSTTYFFRVSASDQSANRTVSSGYTFTTTGIKGIAGIESVASIEQKALVSKAVALLDKITDVEGLKIIESALDEVAENSVESPTILGDPKVEVGMRDATIKWVTDRPSSSIVRFATNVQYSPNKENPYSLSQGQDEELVIQHTVKLIGLEPGTEYHFQVVSRGAVGPSGKSSDKTFKTKSLLPEISNIRMRKIEETRAIIDWRTSVPSSGFVTYTNTKTQEIKSSGSPEFVTSHSVELAGLIFGTTYSAIIEAENEGGDIVKSNPIRFTTVRDEFPPIISKITNESTLFPGSESKIQTIISWGTDEPAICTLSFREGIALAKDSHSLPPELDYTTKHTQVVTEFSPSTVYKFWVDCRDSADNKTRSEDFVLFTPEKEKNIIDIILENFQGTFGWIKNIGK